MRSAVVSYGRIDCMSPMSRHTTRGSQGPEQAARHGTAGMALAWQLARDAGGSCV